MALVKNLIKGCNSTFSIIGRLCCYPETIVNKAALLGMRECSPVNRRLVASQHLYNDMPVRFSRRINEIKQLPIDVHKYSELTQVSDWYVNSIDDVLSSPYPQTDDQCFVFNETITKIIDRHAPTLNIMARGIDKIKKNENSDDSQDYNLNKFLIQFYKNRTRNRLLLQNFVEYFKEEKDDHVGIINLNSNIEDILNGAIEDAEDVADVNRLIFPEIDINIDPLNFTYVDSYLHYVLVEILKNSVRAVNEKSDIDPKITITSNKDEDDNLYILKIKDNGIGIKKEDLHKDKIWNFGYTTSDIDIHNDVSPISGFGYGLSITKVILGTFGDHIKVFSEYGKGTQAYIMIDLKNDWLL